MNLRQPVSKYARKFFLKPLRLMRTWWPESNTVSGFDLSRASMLAALLLGVFGVLIGRAAVIPEGMPPGSDVGNLSLLGYDPAVHHTGRAPIEAASLGIRIRPDQVAFRCNLSTVVTLASR